MSSTSLAGCGKVMEGQYSQDLEVFGGADYSVLFRFCFLKSMHQMRSSCETRQIKTRNLAVGLTTSRSG